MRILGPLVFGAVYLAILTLGSPRPGWPAVPRSDHALPNPNRPGFDGPAELPRVYVKSSLADTPAPGKTINVKQSDDLKKAINEANCGDTISLQAGATFAGFFRLPAKKCDDAHWIIIRTSAPDSALPPEGTRVTPCYAGVASLPGRPDFHCTAPKNVMAKVVFDNKGSGPFTFMNGASHYRFVGLEVTRNTPGSIIYNLFMVERDAVIDHIVFDRVWLHGTPRDETTRGIALGGSAYVAVVDSYLTDFHCTAMTGACVDSQAIAGGLGDKPMGPYKIVNNFMEAAAETILFGGGPAALAPTDIEIRRNHMFKPLAWMPGNSQFVGAANGKPFIVKNLFELKNASRVLFDGNILENSWGGFSQMGFGVLLTPKNQADGKGGNLCPECYVTDVTIRNCRISHVGSGFQIGNGLSGNGGAPKGGSRYSIHDIVVDDIQDSRYGGTGAFAQISMTPTGTIPVLRDVRIDHVTAFPNKTMFILGGPIQEPRMTNFLLTNSILTGGDKPIITTGGGPKVVCSALPDGRGFKTVMDACFSAYTFEHNVIVGGGDFPKGNTVVKKPSDIGFVEFKDGDGGDYELNDGSKFRRSASDGRDLGADTRAIAKATEGVE